MPKDPEQLGKAHEHLTVAYLNSSNSSNDAERHLSKLDENAKKRVKIGSEKAAEFIREATDFEIKEAVEEGDARKPDPNDDIDITVYGDNGNQKSFSLKLTSSANINVRNTLASKISEDIFGSTIEELLSEEELNKYRKLTEQFVEEVKDENKDFRSSDLGGPVKDIFLRKFRDLKTRDEEKLRSKLLSEIRIDSNMVAVKVTASGNFKGFISSEREVFRKFRGGEGELTIETKESNNTSIFFRVDNEDLFRIDMYGQYNGSTPKPRVKCVYRVLFGED